MTMDSTNKVNGTPGGGQKSSKLSVEQARIYASQYFPEFNLQNKVIVMTGGGRGLGLNMAEALFQGGAVVHCLDRLQGPHEDFLNVQSQTDMHLGGELHYHHIDIRDTERLQTLVDSIATQHSRIDGLLTAAGICQVKEALEYTEDEINEIFGINFTGCFMSVQAVARNMKKFNTPGSLVLVASMSGIIVNKGMKSPVYNSTKAAVCQLTRNLAQELGPDGIRMNALCPGHIHTPMVQEVFDKDPNVRQLWEGESMLQRIAKPSEFRGVGIWLLSDASSYVNGSNIVVDGGHTAW